MGNQNSNHPQENSKSNSDIRDTRITSMNKLLKIRLEIELHQYQPALLLVKDRKDFIPTLVEVYKCCKHFVVVRYKCYDPQGNFRQYLYVTVLYVDLMIGCSKLKFFEDDI